MKQIFVLLILLYSLSVSAQKRAASRFAGLDTAFARVLKTWKASGFAVAVVEKNKVIYSKGFGYADYEAKTPVTPNTVFAIGSCTKAFTAGLLGILNQEGKVDFDKPVRTYLPNLLFYNAELTNGVTLRDMMCHRTGLPRHDGTFIFPAPSRDSLIQRIQYMEPAAPLRQRWEYNNMMYVLQGAVAEKLTGKSWEENITSSFFQPLGMTRSSLRYEDWMKTDSIAKGYTLKDDSTLQRLDYQNQYLSAPAGAINSNVNDMAKWVMTWIHGGTYNGREMLPADYAAQAISSQMIVAGEKPNGDDKGTFFYNYGFGWFLDSYRGHYRAEHGGNVDGFTASFCFFPADSIGIVVLCNQMFSIVPSIVRDLVADKMLGLTHIDWNERWGKQYGQDMKAYKKAEAADKLKDSAAQHPATHPLADYTGTYVNKGYGKVVVSLSGDSLMVTNLIYPVYYRHKTYDVFETQRKLGNGYETVNVSQVRFETDFDGNISRILWIDDPDVNPVVFERLLDDKSVSNKSLNK